MKYRSAKPLPSWEGEQSVFLTRKFERYSRQPIDNSPRFPALTASLQTMFNGDTVILSTDGTRAGFDEGLNLQSTPQQMADSILASQRRENDRAVVLVARYSRI